MNETTVANPYVGPRTFSYEQRHLFFGREREARDLTARFLSERLLLFYAQSGAGKSSLLQARIIPQLREEKNFGVLPVARVSGELLPGIEKVDNIYAFNLMTSIDDGEDPSRLVSVSISDFLARLVFKEGKQWVYDATIVPEPAVEQPRRRYALIIDQFEEIITAHPSRWNEREDFFRQLEEAMNDDPNLWVMLTLREDYVAQLDPYANLMTDRLRARFYMERMDVDAAMEAVQRPANQAGGRPFAPGVAEKLVDDLRQVRRPGQEETVPGQHVEPVQLQVVCYQLWEKLKDRPPGSISMDDLEEAGDVDRALAGFYEDAIEAVVVEPSLKTTEGELRNWFDVNLITEAGTRGSVYQGRHRSAGMPNRIIESLANRFLLRRELRAGGAWIELVHDRFVGPIRQSNRAWIELQGPIMRAARDWEDRGRPPELLLAEAQLELARIEAVDGSDPLVEAYLAASEDAINAVAERRRRQAELEQAHVAARDAETRRQAEEARAQEAEARRKEQVATSGRLRRLAALLILISLLAGTTAAAAVMLNMGRQEALEASEANYQIAVRNYEAVLAEQAIVATRSAEAIAARETAELSEALAVHNAAEAIAAQQTAVAERVGANELAANLAKVLTAQAPEPIPTDTPQPSSLSVVLTLIPGQQSAGVLSALDAILLPTATPSPTPTPNLAATEVVVTAQAQLAQVQATQTVVAIIEKPVRTVDALPYVDGVVVSFGGAAGDYLLADPGDSLSGTRWIPVGTTVTLLEAATGDPDYGSGVWYLVEVVDPDGGNQSVEGYLPQEVLAPADARVSQNPSQISQVAPAQQNTTLPEPACRNGWRIEIGEEPGSPLSSGEIHRGYVTLVGEATDSPYQVTVAPTFDSLTDSKPIWSMSSPLPKQAGVLAVLDTHNWAANRYTIALAPAGTTDLSTNSCSIVVEIPPELATPGIDYQNQSQLLPEGPPPILPTADAVISASSPEIVFQWEAQDLDERWVYDLIIQRMENGELIEVQEGGPGVIEWRLPTAMIALPTSRLGGPGNYHWQVRYAENEAAMVHRIGTWGPPGAFIIE